MKRVRGIWLPDTDEHLAHEISLPINPEVDGAGTYQLNKYLAALPYVQMRRHAVDVGANVGLWSRIMEMDFDEVTAIEPVAEHRACFARNVRRTAVLPFAAGAECGQLRIAVPPDHTASAFVADDGEDVEAVTLDSLALPPVDLLKIDVEGYEVDVLMGAQWTIGAYRPVIIVEQKPGNADRYGRGQWDAVDLLKSWGMDEAKVIGGDHIMVWPC